MTDGVVVEQRFEPIGSSVRAVRRFVRDAVHGSPFADDVVLVASELAANVVRHARTEFEVKLAYEGEQIRLEVSDGSSIIPAVEDLAEESRGLRMIEAIAESWAIESTPTGKLVWVLFPHRTPSVP